MHRITGSDLFMHSNLRKNLLERKVLTKLNRNSLLQGCRIAVNTPLKVCAEALWRSSSAKPGMLPLFILQLTAPINTVFFLNLGD